MRKEVGERRCLQVRSIGRFIIFALLVFSLAGRHGISKVVLVGRDGHATLQLDLRHLVRRRVGVILTNVRLRTLLIRLVVVLH